MMGRGDYEQTLTPGELGALSDSDLDDITGGSGESGLWCPTCRDWTMYRAVRTENLEEQYVCRQCKHEQWIWY
ncbi:MAG TPA: hypothetical protein PLM25_03780 [Limnochordia bacterium]|nr:hypothetical protein [Limnochordia bacterium]